MTGIATATHPEHASSRRRRMTRAVARRWPTGAAIAGAAASLALWGASCLTRRRPMSAPGACCLPPSSTSPGALPAGTSPGQRLCAQTAGVLGFGAVAIAAVAATPSVGRFVLAGGWLGHAIWDAVHHRAQLGRPPLVRGTCLVCNLIIAAALLAVG